MSRLLTSLLPVHNRSLTPSACTAEGDNYLLKQQTTRYLLKVSVCVH